MKRLILVLGFIFLMSFVFASAPPPSPNCEIIGKVINVSCDYCEPSMLTVEPKYNFLILINKVSYINGSLEYSTCEESFVEGESQRFYDDTPNFAVDDKVRLTSRRQPYLEESPIYSFELIENYCETDFDCGKDPDKDYKCGEIPECNNNECHTLLARCPRPNVFQKIINWLKNIF
ncbi:hypothetical protein J4474_04435 [Candidatus Pacearchaeota archaeon]|nr:hypothetical protein [Candidatus Pacearchaeota archaeon]